MSKLSSPFFIIKRSFETFASKDNFLSLVKVYSPVGALSAISLLFIYVPFLSSFAQSQTGGMTMTVFDLFFLLVMIFTNLAGILALIDIGKGETVDVKKTFDKSLSKYWKFLLLSLVFYAINILGLVLLIIPFFLFATWFAFSKIIMIDRSMGIRESLIQSKKMVKGRFWKILGRIIVFGLFSFLLQIASGVLPYGVGTVVFYLCGGLLVLPTLLLYKEIASDSVNG